MTTQTSCILDLNQKKKKRANELPNLTTTTANEGSPTDSSNAHLISVQHRAPNGQVSLQKE